MPTSPFTIEACQALAQEQMEMPAYVRGRLFILGSERSDLGGPSLGLGLGCLSWPSDREVLPA